MKYLLKFILSVLILCACSKKKDSVKEYVDNRIGVAPYALLHPGFPCGDFLKSLERLPHIHISILWNTFGNNLSCLGSVLKNPKTQSLQVHLINETCMRKKDACGDYEIFSGSLTPKKLEYHLEKKTGWVTKEIQDYSAHVAGLLKANQRPGLKFYISPGLESNLEDNAAHELIQIIKPIFAGVAEIVWNPVSSSTKNKNGADYLELHDISHALPAPCFFNLDGRTIVFPDEQVAYPRTLKSSQVPVILSKYEGCQMRYLWHNSYNCGVGYDSKFIDPRKRVCNNKDDVFNKITNLIPIVEKK